MLPQKAGMQMNHKRLTTQRGGGGGTKTALSPNLQETTHSMLILGVSDFSPHSRRTRASQPMLLIGLF